MSRKRAQLTRKGSHIRLYEDVLLSPAYIDLSVGARALMIELARLYRPGRNGTISLSVRNAAKRLGVASNTVTKHFSDLAEHGFIKMRQGAIWHQGMAREWYLTWLHGNNNQEPTDDWKKWKCGFPVFVLPSKKTLVAETDTLVSQKVIRIGRTRGAQ